jgi:4-diphosphocytidyl-2-C-methyl-D-erythritol kinase
VSSISVKAFAKINLGLRILKKRPDGYHDIETVFHRVNIFDELTFEEADSISLAGSDALLPSDDTNLCIRAAKLLQQHCNCRRGARIILNKKIPVGAGLGGGSSDAAATLLSLGQLWNLEISENKLTELALQLGSDVSYFLHSGAAYAKGRGEILEYFPLILPFWIVVVYPNIHISTAWAYARVQPDEKTSTLPLKDIVQRYCGDGEALSKYLINDFEPVVKAHYPQIADILGALKGSGAGLVQLSGSGSSVYGLFSREADAEQFARKLGNVYKTFVTPPRFKPSQS